MPQLRVVDSSLGCEADIYAADAGCFDGTANNVPVALKICDVFLQYPDSEWRFLTSQLKDDGDGGATAVSTSGDFFSLSANPPKYPGSIEIQFIPESTCYTFYTLGDFRTATCPVPVDSETSLTGTTLAVTNFCAPDTTAVNPDSNNEHHLLRLSIPASGGSVSGVLRVSLKASPASGLNTDLPHTSLLPFSCF